MAKIVSPVTEKATGIEHGTTKGDVRLFLWEKFLPSARASFDDSLTPILVLVHGSSMASTPTFDLDVPGRPDYNVMDYFAQRGYDVWCFDCEGYGRSDKLRDIPCDVATGADDCEAAAHYIRSVRGERPLHFCGISSGALRAALFAERHPEQVRRLALHAFVWTGDGSPTLEERRKRLPEYVAGGNRRPIDAALVRSIFTRDHPGTADQEVIDAFGRAILALDDSVPIGTYVDMCAKLPLVDPERIIAPTLITRGEYDGIASLGDLLEFFSRLATSDKQFVVLPGMAHSAPQEKNHHLWLDVVERFFAQPVPEYRG